MAFVGAATRLRDVAPPLLLCTAVCSSLANMMASCGGHMHAFDAAEKAFRL